MMQKVINRLFVFGLFLSCNSKPDTVTLDNSMSDVRNHLSKSEFLHLKETVVDTLEKHPVFPLKDVELYVSPTDTMIDVPNDSGIYRRSFFHAEIFGRPYNYFPNAKLSISMYGDSTNNIIFLKQAIDNAHADEEKLYKRVLTLKANNILYVLRLDRDLEGAMNYLQYIAITIQGVYVNYLLQKIETL